MGRGNLLVRIGLAVTGGMLAGGAAGAEAPSVRVAVRNPLDLARASETVELRAADVRSQLATDDLARVHVFDGTSEVLAQSVDLDGEGAADQLVFQADFGPGQERVFTLTSGEPRVYRREDFRVYGRFVRERFDDFAWENDRIAHRTYGEALETWQKEPLTSSTIDMWVKRTRRLVINDWYMVDDYHRDHGEGADFYSAGKSRGCGGSGLWRAGRLYTSKNFRDSRVLANGPIRLVFELTYLPWDVGAGVSVSEVKRVTLDAGHNLGRFESRYETRGGELPAWAAGIKKAAGAVVRVDRERGLVRTWEDVKDGNGHLGCAILVEPSALADVAEADGNVLAIGRGPAAYWAGFGWDRSGDFADLLAWDRYLEEAARRLHAPLDVRFDAR